MASTGCVRLALSVLLLQLLTIVGTIGTSCSGQTSCPQVNPSFYTVHIVPHSHMDLGWLKTVEQYFFGTKANITSVGVQYIYDSVLTELLTDPDRRFMFVETGFFELWWRHRDNSTRENFKRLVLNGQIEFVSGGYVMNDEAAVHYINTIDQMTYGLGILKEIFGECGVSRVGWQIDPFGHSREFASLLSQMGFQGLFLGRIDYQDKKLRQATKTMEFNWLASESLAQSRLTGIVLANNYAPPPGFCFDDFCDDEVIVEDTQSREFNGKRRANDFIKWLTDKAKYYATNNFLVTMGEDFNYQNAKKWMANLDALMRVVNGKGYTVNGLPVRLVYSTPRCYLAAVQDQKMTTKSDDFFPYASDPHSYWTGYFTSRPSFKFLDRFANNWFQAAKQLAAMAGLGPDRLKRLRRALAIAQHHDAITGTAKQHVNDDYIRMMSIGLTEAEKVAAEAVNALSGSSESKAADVIFCRGLNISQCDKIEHLFDENGFTVTAYNPFSQKVQTIVRVPLPSTDKNFTVIDPNGNEVPFDIFPISEGVKTLAERNGKATHELAFLIRIEALAFTSVDIRVQPLRERKVPLYNEAQVTEARTITRGVTQLDVHPTLGITRLTVNGVSTKFRTQMYFYPSHGGNNSESRFRASGAYIFRPAGPAEILPLTSATVVEGNHMSEIRFKYGTWAYVAARMYPDIVDLDWIVGPVPITDNRGKELAIRFSYEADSGSEFFTDSNGREMMRRQRDSRPTWPLSLDEPVAGNYYPVDTMISINDTKHKLTIITDRSLGGSSLKSGDVELMLLRRCLYDDAFGVGEALNETGVDGRGLQVRGTLKFFTDEFSPSSNNDLLRPQALQMSLQPILAFSRKPIRVKQTFINPAALPENVQLLTLEQTSPKEYLVRLENIFERKDNPKVATVSLSELFHGEVLSVRETLLAANINKPKPPNRTAINTDDVTLYPMQIRTFFVTVR